MLAVHVERQLGEFSVDVLVHQRHGGNRVIWPVRRRQDQCHQYDSRTLKPQRGRIDLDGDVLFDGGGGIDVPAWRRRIGYVFREARCSRTSR